VTSQRRLQGEGSSVLPASVWQRRPSTLLCLPPCPACLFRCWAPPAPSSPTLTLASVVAGMPPHYIDALRTNRLAYAARHGYT
jgi:hypothetical protein